MSRNLGAKEWWSVDKQESDICAVSLEVLPVKVGELAHQLGLIVLSATLPTGVSGEIRPSKTAPSGFEIRVNRHENKKRQRFTVAHEIGHFLLHREKIKEGIVDNVLYRSALSSTIEAEANRIAADILMPRQTLKKFLSEYYSKFVTESQLDEIADHLKVSKVALKIRLGIADA